MKDDSAVWNLAVTAKHTDHDYMEQLYASVGMRVHIPQLYANIQ